ncbi:MAG: STAS domain-containing protein [Nocardioides sp.]|nr:STAS domain-containing protein [Nocardioides sp.]
MKSETVRPGPTGSPVLRVEEQGRYSVVVLTGEVDLATATDVRVCLRDLMVDGATHVLVDLRAVTFMDSTGLGVLVAARKQARVFRGSFGLVAPSPPVARVLSLTALDKFLPCFASVAEASLADPTAELEPTA